jgi:AcrR family transcriptional regulator
MAKNFVGTSELRSLHPRVARWLTENGYTFEHEVRMPEYGRADFVARDDKDNLFIVECKVNLNASDGRSIIQLLDYCRQIPESRGCYAIPSNLVSEYITRLCQLYNVIMIPIDMAVPLSDEQFLKPRFRNKTKGELHEKYRNEIKAVARQQMIEKGAASIGLRAIARDLGITAPALYRYFANLDELITSLALDASNNLVNAMLSADRSQTPDDYYKRLFAIFMEYHDWALHHPLDFQLIYGNPVPGYVPPNVLNTIAARCGIEVVAGVLNAAYQVGELQIPVQYRSIPEKMSTHLAEYIKSENTNTPPIVIYLTVVSWTRIHGAVMVELFEHIQPVSIQGGIFYRLEVEHMLNEWKLKAKS